MNFTDIARQFDGEWLEEVLASVSSAHNRKTYRKTTHREIPAPARIHSRITTIFIPFIYSAIV